MQSLRGLAELGELAPLPEILDGIELAVGDLTRLFAPPPGVDEVMAAGVVSADPHLAGHRRARTARAPRPRRPAASPSSCSCAPSRSSATSCRSSRSSSPATPSRSRPRWPSRSSPPPAPLGPLELVSHGEHLCQSADLIAARALGRSSAIFGSIICSARCAPPATPGPDPVAGALGRLRPLGPGGARGGRGGPCDARRW